MGPSGVLTAIKKTGYVWIEVIKCIGGGYILWLLFMPVCMPACVHMGIFGRLGNEEGSLRIKSIQGQPVMLCWYHQSCKAAERR